VWRKAIFVVMRFMHILVTAIESNKW